MGLGINLVINGTFDTNTDGWTVTDATIAAVSGQLEVTSASGGYARQYITTVVGENYRVIYDVFKGTGDDYSVRFGSPYIPNAGTDFDPPRKSYDVESTTEDMLLRIFSDYSLTSSNTMYYDNISIMEILPDPTVGTLSLGSTGSTTQGLSWTAADVNGGSAIAGYDIYKDGSLDKSVGVVTSDTVTGLTASTEYSWTIKARNSDDTAGESAFSNEVTATTEGGATTTVEIEWIDSISAAATGNKIYRDDVEIADVANGIQFYSDDEAPVASTPKYEVQAHDGAGDETTQEVEGVNMDYITTAS